MFLNIYVCQSANQPLAGKPVAIWPRVAIIIITVKLMFAIEYPLKSKRLQDCADFQKLIFHNSLCPSAKSIQPSVGSCHAFKYIKISLLYFQFIVFPFVRPSVRNVHDRFHFFRRIFCPAIEIAFLKLTFVTGFLLLGIFQRVLVDAEFPGKSVCFVLFVFFKLDQMVEGRT